MIRVFVEMPAGATVERRRDAVSGALRDAMSLPAPTPFAFGELPDFIAGDGAAVGCWVLTSEPLGEGQELLGEVLGLVEQFEGDVADPKVLIGLPDEPALRDGDGGDPSPEALDAVLAWMRAMARARRDSTVRIGDVLGPEAAAMQLAALRRAQNMATHRPSGPPPADGA